MPAVDPIAAEVSVPGRSVRLDAGAASLHALVAGPEDGPLVVLLHGFPEFWYGWHRAVEPLVAAGYRVVVPDQRGYNRSDKPDAVAAYHVRHLAADAVGLLDALGRESAAFVGHDWGGGVAWWAAIHHPRRVDRLVTVNAPHPTVMVRRLLTDPRQLLRTWYVLAFQLPWLPERVARLGGWALGRAGMARTSRPGTFTAADLDRYRRAWDRPGAFAAMLDWYRAAARDPPAPEPGRVTLPTKLLWGGDDRFLRPALARESRDRCADARLRVLDGTHWVHHERPATVAAEITAFLP